VGFILVGHILFNTDAVQSSLFRQGAGTYSDLVQLDAGDLKTGGRLVAWPIFIENIPNWVVGGGSASSSRFGREYFNGQWAHPHTEYIRLVFDYGLIGLSLLLLPLLVLYRRLGAIGARNENSRFLARVARTGLIGMSILAVTGNVLVYVVW